MIVLQTWLIVAAVMAFSFSFYHAVRGEQFSFLGFTLSSLLWPFTIVLFSLYAVFIFLPQVVATLFRD